MWCLENCISGKIWHNCILQKTVDNQCIGQYVVLYYSMNPLKMTSSRAIRMAFMFLDDVISTRKSVLIGARELITCVWLACIHSFIKTVKTVDKLQLRTMYDDKIH